MICLGGIWNALKRLFEQAKGELIICDARRRLEAAAEEFGSFGEQFSRRDAINFIESGVSAKKYLILYRSVTTGAALRKLQDYQTSTSGWPEPGVCIMGKDGKVTRITKKGNTCAT